MREWPFLQLVAEKDVVRHNFYLPDRTTMSGDLPVNENALMILKDLFVSTFKMVA